MIVYKCSECGSVVYCFPNDWQGRCSGCLSVEEVLWSYMICPGCFRELRKTGKVVVHG